MKEVIDDDSLGFPNKVSVEQKYKCIVNIITLLDDYMQHYVF